MYRFLTFFVLTLFVLPIFGQINIQVAKQLHESGKMSNETYIDLLENQNINRSLTTDDILIQNFLAKNGEPRIQAIQLAPILKGFLGFIRNDIVKDLLTGFLDPDCKKMNQQFEEIGRQVWQDFLNSNINKNE